MNVNYAKFQKNFDSRTIQENYLNVDSCEGWVVFLADYHCSVFACVSQLVIFLVP